jgi:hypothetical protein
MKIIKWSYLLLGVALMLTATAVLYFVLTDAGWQAHREAIIFSVGFAFSTGFTLLSFGALA